MAAQHGAAGEVRHDLAGHGAVGEEHHLLHHLVGLPHLVHADVHGVVRLRVELEADLGRGERQRARVAAPLAQDLCDAVHLAQGLCDWVVDLGVVHPGLRLKVRHGSFTLDDALAVLDPHHVRLGRHLPKDGERQPLHVSTEGADILGEWFGEHVDAPLDEVHGRAAPRGLEVDGRAAVHEVGDVGDVDAHLEVTVGQLPHMQRIVDVAAAWWVDGADVVFPKVDPVGIRPVLVADTPRERRHALVHGHRERRGVDIVLDHKHLGFRLLITDGAEGAHVVPRRVLAVSLPPVESHNDALIHQVLRLPGLNSHTGELALDWHEEHAVLVPRS
mmetsp:Transcript_62634/g.198323  ORF Transcript_62634/g.198323 Transcript_62634/m.198323 type:complete len:331 (-) Transcript_62634:165-1157(-)